jgi:glycerol-3-phosphate acyltransferase PlsY
VRRPIPAPMVVGAAFLAGSVPFSNIAARARAGVDLRDVGGGTVSGTALHQVTGFGPLAVAGACDVA